MRSTRGWSLPVLLLAALLGAAPAAAGETPSEDAAKAVAEAHRAGDAAKLKALAASDKPDPWRVAEVLLARAVAGAAAAFAAAAPRPAVARLPEYVRARRERPTDPAYRAAVAAAARELAADRNQAALDALPKGLPAFDDVASVQALSLRGIATDRLGKSAEAEKLYTEGAERALRLGWTTYAAMTFRLLGTTLAARYDMAGAVAAYKRALAAFRTVGDEAEAGAALDSAAHALGRLGEVDQGMPLATEALRTGERLGDLGLQCTALRTLGELEERRGDRVAARAFRERALVAAEKSGDRVAIVMSLQHLGNVLGEFGEVSRALSLHERALELAQALQRPDLMGPALTSIAVHHKKLGDFQKALEYAERALEALGKGGDAHSIAAATMIQGNAYLTLKRPADALRSYEKAYALLERMGDSDAATAIGNMALAHENMGNSEKALEAYGKALALARRLHHRDAIARTLWNMSNVHTRKGDDASATRLREEALVEAEAAGDLVVLMTFLHGMTVDRFNSGRHAEAIAFGHRAVELLPGLVGRQGDEAGARARRTQESLFHAGAAAATTLKDAAEAFFFLESGRAGSLLEALGGRAALRAAVVPAALREAEDAARAKERAASAEFRKAAASGDEDRARARKTELDAARAAVGDVVERIQREAKAAADVAYPKAATLADVQARLADGDVLVVLGLYEENTMAVVASRTEARVVALGDTPQIIALAARFSPSAPDAAQAAEALRARVVGLLKIEGTPKRVLVSPDGVLSQVPFSLLFPGSDVIHVPSGTSLKFLTPEKKVKGAGVLALGDPDYGTARPADALARLRGGLALEPLPATREEAKAVGDKVLLGKDATKQGFLAALASRPRWAAVHLACHGLVDPERPANSSLALTATPTDDGFLTALDVWGLKVPADLVVLSACETARGKVYAAEGVVGLVRAFMVAGSPRVLASLWKVDDRATKLLMTTFYEQWRKKGLAAPAALRKAQETVRDFEETAVDPVASRAAGKDVRTKRRPFAALEYWAAWVLWGLPE